MICRWPVGCKHCGKVIAFMIGVQPAPSIYCYACEPAVTHKEEMREEEAARYRKLMTLQDHREGQS